MIDGLADLHKIDWRGVGLGEFGKPEGYAGRQVDGWTRRWQSAKTDDVDKLDAVAAWLAANLPADADADAALIHNDYKYDNVLLDAEVQTSGQIRVNAVRDLGLGPALAGAVNRFAERTGLEVRFAADPQAASFADARAETMFRIAEEALRNIDRHAKASHVDVALKDLPDGMVELVIADDGVGFDPAAEHPGHYGVLGIREQAQLIEADLDLHSAPGAGATVRVRLRVGPEMNPMEER